MPAHDAQQGILADRQHQPPCQRGRGSTAQGNAASVGPTKLSLTSSVGPTGTVGIAYNIAHTWNLYASYSISQVKTKLNADTAGVIRTTHISFGPQAVVVAVGYSF